VLLALESRRYPAGSIKGDAAAQIQASRFAHAAIGFTLDDRVGAY
jgi:hypothetical protein